LGFSLTPAAPTHGRTHRGERFPRSVPEPEPSSRHLCAGHPSGQEFAGTRQTHPGATTGPRFRFVVDTLSTFHQWFTHVRLLGSHLTHHVRLFRNAHHHDSFTAAACGGLESPPAWAIPEGLPPSPVQHRIQRLPSTPEPPSAFVAHGHRRISPRPGCRARCDRRACRPDTAPRRLPPSRAAQR